MVTLWACLALVSEVQSAFQARVHCLVFRMIKILSASAKQPMLNQRHVLPSGGWRNAGWLAGTGVFCKPDGRAFESIWSLNKLHSTFPTSRKKTLTFFFRDSNPRACVQGSSTLSSRPWETGWAGLSCILWYSFLLFHMKKSFSALGRNEEKNIEVLIIIEIKLLA